ncbi:(2Fe-2S)-binding protein [Streptomyces xiaopingdaonensis]|uniref:(2Fe-2S)-binding protein n=1 Tax=Streptomyces xiaopingdaonensis TaxID=1565415 RepID=UPI001ED8D7D7|nr:(2Fe-2S)-binding protein [Streptomyces xiaopingdaonensis]
MTHYLDRLRCAGPHFDLATGERDDTGDFLSLAEVYRGRDGALKRYACHVAEVIGTEEPRVAASTLHLGTVARLASLALGSAALGGAVPDLRPEALRWRAPGGVVQLWLPELRELPAERGLSENVRQVFAAHLTQLDAAVHRLWKLSPQVMRGNAGSAVAGAVRVLGREYPEAGRRAARLAATLLPREPLAGAGEFALNDETLAFARNNCCLYYRVRGAGTCGDCVLRERRSTREPAA